MSYDREELLKKVENFVSAPFDARFPNTNQTINCVQNYVDHHRCLKKRIASGEDLLPCEWYRRVYKSLCPESWTEKWDEQRAKGIYPHKI